MYRINRTRIIFSLVGILVLLAAQLGGIIPAAADHTPDPTTVTIAGSLQGELGCPGDWQPECAATHLTDDVNDDVWQRAFSVPAGSWEYKAALNDSWTENYGANAQPNGANIALTLAATADVKFYYDHKSHWVTDNVNSVIATVPGSFQSELGCSGDWAPDCLRSWLQDPDGDGIYSFTTSAIPEGNYEAKVAHNESGDVNYGAGGVLNGPNIAFSVGPNATMTFRYDPATHLLDIFVEGGLEPGDELLVRPVLQHPFQDQVLYFTMPDRFSNGSVANDCGAYAGPCATNDTEANVLTHGFLPSNRGYYHGGDLAGLRSKLDYLANMGVTAVWVGPVFMNKTVQVDSTSLYGHSSGYHGYWILDYQQVDPHLGTNQEFQDLVNAAHALGIRVFMDIITNHTADVIQLEGSAAYRNKTDFPYRDANGVAFDDADYAGTSTFPAIDPLISFPYVPTIPAGEETAKNPAWLNDPAMYHNRGNTSFTGENSKYGDFFGLDDLWTERPEVVAGMIDIYQYWIDNYGVDGFRIDTTKHVNMEFWQEFGPDILAAAQAAGIDDFFAFGEVYDQVFGSSFVSEFSTRGKLQSTIDFGFQMADRAFASQSGPTDGLRDFFASDDYYTDADSNAYIQPTFTGNHDMGRIGYFLVQDNPGAVDAELLARSKLAQALMYFARGTPVIYYGDEQGFTGDGGDKLARQDMFPSLVPEYNDDDLIGTTATTADDNFDATHPIYLALADYATVRQANATLRSGAQIHRYSSSTPGVYAFSRIGRDEKIEYMLAFNNTEAANQATAPTFYGAGMQFDLVYAEGGSPSSSLTTDANGSLTLDVPPLGFVIYKASAPIAPSTAAPSIRITNLTNNQEVTLQVQERDGHAVTDRVEVDAAITPQSFAEVTFAVKVNDGEYTPIGTDNNPPYRIFYDVTALPQGATLSFKAIVNDLSGNLNAAKVEGIAPIIETPPPPGTASHAVIHYFRSDSDYGDHTTGDYNDYWGLHLWGDITETIDWTAPKPFLGDDEYGRFAWVNLSPGAANVGFIVHRGNAKDGTDADRFFNPSLTPEIWLKGGDGTTYTSQAAAQGYATIHYHRPDGVYTDWGLHLWGDAIADGVGTSWASPRPYDGIDDFGAYWNVPLKDVSMPLNFIIHKGDEKDPGPDQSFIPQDDASVWIMSMDETIYAQRGAAQNFATLHYRRPAGDYGDYTSTNYADFWGLHTWLGADDPGWTTPRKPVRQDSFGQVFEVPLFEAATQIGYILHRDDDKDPGADQFLEFAKYGYEVWQLQGADIENPYILPILVTGGPNPGNIGEKRAYWVSEDTIAWEAASDPANSYRLYYAPDGGLQATDAGITGGSYLTLTRDPAGLPADVQTKFPHLAALPALKINSADLALVPGILRGQIAVSALTPDGISVDATGLQIPGVLDDLFTYDGELGISWEEGGPTPGGRLTIRIWAPTAKSVSFHLFDDSNPATAGARMPMAYDTSTGVWSISGEPGWKNKYYLYEVEVYVPSTGQVEHNYVTDPYSFSLSMNSTRSQIVDLREAALKPAGWDAGIKPPLVAPEDISIYELHVRDYSAADSLVPPELKGTFKAFTLKDTYGYQHLSSLVSNGLTHLHLLPTFDIATINENKSEWQSPDPVQLATYPPDSDQQQAAVGLTADLDAFNWGYDPLHYTVPEGSYSTDPDGPARIVEFREMVQSLNNLGLRVVIDVVYNHTNASGQNPNSVLDRIVPGYYHRLNDSGVVETSTCCANTASEHNMMEKLMVDSVVTWAKQYKVDGFRFDLMGHHMVRNMQKVRDALDALTLAEDGVDGKSIYVYGEGWNFGEVANNARGVNATQSNLAGTGIGTFNDRSRDAVRGIGPFDSGQGLLEKQGFANGMFYDPKATVPGAPAEQLGTLLLQTDQIKVGMAGNLANFTFIDRNGNLVTGADVDYNGSPAGYNRDPQEDISYVEAHDNQTLFDINIYAAPQTTSMADRVRMQVVGLSTIVLGQGVPFIHAGSDMLRSKSLDRNSFNSGDWFNSLDFSLETNNFGVGLPPAGSNQGDWSIMQPFLADPGLKPGEDSIALANSLFGELMRIRYSSMLFRLGTELDVQARVAFLNNGPDQQPGLVVMTLSDQLDDDLDGNHEKIVVLINANDELQTFTAAEMAGLKLALHPVQRASVDQVVRNAGYNWTTGTFFIPARTAAVFVAYDAPTTRIMHLIEAVQALVDSEVLNKGQGNSLIVKLQAAIKSLNRGNTIAASNQLTAFTQEIEALHEAGVLTADQAQALIDTAMDIIYQIRGGY